MNTTYQNIMDAYTAEEWAEFVFFSASIQHVLGESRLSVQLDLYHRYLEYLEWQADFGLLTGTVAAFSERLQQCLDQGAILVSFHFGQYRLIPLSLLARGYKVCILVSRDVYTAQLAYYKARLHPDWFAHLQFVQAEDPRLFFQLRQYTRAGYVLLCYVDGASGVHRHSTPHSQGTLEVGLGHAAVRARAGFAAMAYLLHRPIGVVFGPIGTRDQKVVLDVDAVYRPQDHRSRTGYVQHAVKGIYTQLSQALTRYPTCWECWTYLHELMPITPRDAEWPPADRYIPFERKGDAFLLDKAQYTVYPLEKGRFNMLKKATVLVY